jgi:hypothetical protein
MYDLFRWFLGSIFSRKVKFLEFFQVHQILEETTSPTSWPVNGDSKTPQDPRKSLLFLRYHLNGDELLLSPIIRARAYSDIDPSDMKIRRSLTKTTIEVDR